jgi:hypothetical protein
MNSWSTVLDGQESENRPFRFPLLGDRSGCSAVPGDGCAPAAAGRNVAIDGVLSRGGAAESLPM